MRLTRGRRVHVAGWTGPVLEDAEPDTVEGAGALDDGLNLMAQSGRRRTVRGGSRIITTFGAVGGNAVTDCWGPFRYSATGAVAVGHVSGGPEHYAYALDDEGGWAAATEALSRGAMSWASATPGRPLGVELYERLYLVDASEATTRQGMAVGVWSGGAWTVSQPTYDLDGSGGSPGVLRAYCAEVFNGVLFVSGYDSESAPSNGNAPHLIRHSLLGTEPSSASGFDKDAYLILGAKGQFVRAMKAGRTVLMAAKDSELYLLSGAGRSLPGWQYQVQQVSNSLGAGCTNPYALEHAYGVWYGVGKVGPWRCDGGSVELLRAGRDRSWSRVQNPQLATVTAHPDRRQIWFGFYETGRTGYAEAPCTFWVWDLEREQWDCSQRTNRSYTFLGSIAQGSVVAPAGSPSVPAQDFTDAAFAYDAVEVEWTPNDVTADTEVWYKVSGGSYVLAETVPAGLARCRIGSLSGSSTYDVKLRHVKGAVVSDFSGAVTCYTRVLRSRVIAGSVATTDAEASRDIRTVNYSADATMTVTDNASYSQVYTAEPAGNRTATDTSPYGTIYTVATNAPTWPGSYQDAANANGYQEPIGGATTPRAVQLFGSSFVTGSMTGQYWPNTHGDTYAVEVYDGGAWGAYHTQASPSNGTALGPVTFTIDRLAGGAAVAVCVSYQVRVTNQRTGVSSSEVTFYTAIPAPAAVVVTSTGAGTPVVNVAVTLPTQSGATAQVYVHNADKSYDAITGTNYALSGAVVNIGTTAGACGTMDQYWVRLYKASWPAGYQFGPPLADTVSNPCAVGS